MLDTHLWIVAPYRQDRLEAIHATLGQETHLLQVDCHCQRRGPYTGTGELLRALVPGMYRRWPHLVMAHAREILSIAPELQAIVPAPPATLTALAIPKERTRFYGRVYTRRLAQGIINFLLEYSAAGGGSIGPIFFDNVQAADFTDQEVLALLIRRVKPHQCVACVGTTSDQVTAILQQALTISTHPIQVQPLALQVQQRIPPSWKHWLQRIGLRWHGEWEALRDIPTWPACAPPDTTSWEQGLSLLVAHLDPDLRQALGRSYVASEGTSDHPLQQRAYQQTGEHLRRQWHDERAEILERWEQWSLHLGAIAYHREHGQHAATLGADRLAKAINYCVEMGFYDATKDLGERGRRLVGWEAEADLSWVFTSKLAISLATLDRLDEAEDLLNEARMHSSDPVIHIQAAYMTAMNYTRHRGLKHRNHLLAKGWINVAKAIAQGIADPEERAFQLAFQDNGMALVELHLGHAEKALQLVEGAIAQLDHQLEQDQHRLHRSVLLYNRGQVYARLGKWEEALAAYTAVIALDPHFSEYYLDRGNLYRAQKQYAEALEDYQQVLKLSPPYPEIYYNRALLLVDMERPDEALADYHTLLELEPEYLDALVNRASLFYEQGAYEAARLDIKQGLQLHAGHAQLLCLWGLLEMAEEHFMEAHHAFSSAIAQDPSLGAAWTNRAVLAFDQGQIQAAIDDLTQALTLGEDAAVRYNRGIAHQSLEQWDQAIEDFTVALTLEREDEQDLLYRRGRCFSQQGNTDRAHQDFQAHLALGSSPYEAELRQSDPSLT